MSETLATYSFLPWLRQGISNNITTLDNDQNVKLRASIDVILNVAATKLDGTPVNDPSLAIPQKIQLYGPGDITGIDSKAIVKTEPRNLITNFESNYLPYIEFYEEDFPWRYTPASPDIAKDQLRPWLTLVVLKEDEFEDGQNMKDMPLPFFNLKEGKHTMDLFPSPAELWAWAHVHVNTDLSNDAAANAANATSVNAAVSGLIQQNPDQAYSRILCPRKLEGNTGYYAFLIPTFESGRLAGLGIDPPGTLTATTCAWEITANIQFPYYYRWYFRTGPVGDFEYLVNLLKPKTVDKTVGVRDMDVMHPGSNLPAIGDENLNENEKLKGILKLGGALRAPLNTLTPTDLTEVKKYDEWGSHPSYPHPFMQAMANRINLAYDYTNATVPVKEINKLSGITINNDPNAGDPDPVITAPLYGRWQALQQRLLKESNQSDNKNWIHELNLDPRYRVAAGLGTKVIQKGQDEYMQAAWEQVGKIIEANNKIRLAQLAKEVSSKLYSKHITSLDTERAFIFTAPVQKRIMYDNLTAYSQVAQSTIPRAIVSSTFRRITRPGSAMMKNLQFTAALPFNNFVQRINTKAIVVAAPKAALKTGITLSTLTTSPIAADTHLTRMESLISAPPALVSIQKLEKAAVLRTSPDFVISKPGSTFTPTTGTTDSAEAKNFKAALDDVFTMVNIKFDPPERKTIDLTKIKETIIQSLNPATSIPNRTFDSINIPLHIKQNMVETFAPVMAYPVIDRAMYKPLADMSSDLFLPNINLIEENSITLLENNQKFIESYMVGINHEMSKELLWREYPTDQRGTYFRQFWDAGGFLPATGNTDEANKELLRDIKPISTWPKTTAGQNLLGQHNQRVSTGGDAKLVLVIRGELLKKYPTAVIYAQKAAWASGTTFSNGASKDRILLDLVGVETSNPPGSKFKTPLFEAKVDPDIYFLGFDLTASDACGTLKPTSKNDDPGWFFVIHERTGEPRFGLDINQGSEFKNWDQMSWKHIPAIKDGDCIMLQNNPVTPAFNPTTGEDIQARWNINTNSAQLAYILYQEPVLVAVHASRMLQKK